MWVQTTQRKTNANNCIAPKKHFGQGLHWKMEQYINPISLKTAKTLWSFGRSECNRVKAMAEESESLWK